MFSTDPDVELRWREWLASRPPEIRALAEKYPPGTRFNIHGVTMYLVSYGEYGEGKTGLGISPIDPRVHYEAAQGLKQNICPCCVPKLDSLRI